MGKKPQFVAMTFKSRHKTRINNTSKGQELIRHRRTKDHVPWPSSVPLRSPQMCPAPQAFSTHWEAGTLLDWHFYHQVLHSHLHFMACLRVLEMKRNMTAGCQFLQWKFVVVLTGLCVFGIRKVGFPLKQKPNVKISDSRKALFINTACERNGEKKNPVFVK